MSWLKKTFKVTYEQQYRSPRCDLCGFEQAPPPDQCFDAQAYYLWAGRDARHECFDAEFPKDWSAFSAYTAAGSNYSGQEQQHACPSCSAKLKVAFSGKAPQPKPVAKLPNGFSVDKYVNGGEE